MLYRCYSLSSDWFAFNTEINFLKNFFENNAFPSNCFNKVLREFLNKQINPISTSNTHSNNNERIKYITLPFYGHLSYEIRKKLSFNLKGIFPEIKFRFIFTNELTIRSFFKFKDRIPADLTPNVIYEFICPHCEMRYLGMTTRNLCHRICEHKGISSRTFKQLSHPAFSAIREHSHDRDHTFNENNFKILHRTTSIDIRTLEAIYIKHLKPELNNQQSTKQLLLL